MVQLLISKSMFLSFRFQTCLLSSVEYRLLTFLNVDLCPLKRSLNSFFVSPMYVSYDPSLLFVIVAWYITDFCRQLKSSVQKWPK